MFERLLILAPRGRDTAVIEQVLTRARMGCHVCADLEALRGHLEQDAGGILLTEEALAGPALEPLLAWCEGQPPWSDIPVIVLATRQAGYRSASAGALLDRLGNVVLLERPVNAETLASAARASLRARRRQYQARTLLEERERRERELSHLNETLERRVEERARELDQAHEALGFALDSAGMGSWDLDLATDASWRTPQHDRLFGYAGPPASWGRDSFLAHALPEDRAAAAQAFAKATGTGTLDHECRIRRSDGAVRWIIVKGRVTYGPDGQPARMAGVVMDVTERRLIEDALSQAQKMEAIGQLTGGVAHDFNNLLTVIVGGLDMMMRRPGEPGRVVRLAEAAMTAARRGEQLTQQLLAFSRRQMLRPQTLDPGRLLREFAELAKRAVGEAVTLRFELDPQTHPIRIDPAQLESAVLNLIVNARDAMPAGGTIVVASRNVPGNADVPGRAGGVPPGGPSGAPLGTRAPGVPPVALPGILPGAPPGAPPGDRGPGDWMVISVTDSGSGIDPQTLARAFEPFFTTKEVGKGSGLGLSQVYGFTRSAGGTVALRSEVGRGTTVELYFPRSADALSEERQAPPGAAALQPASGETVLLVEDDEQVLAMAVESLEELRYTVLVARDAAEALSHVRRRERIDVLFSDVVMPGGMNGAQLAVEARRLRPALKVLLTSGYVGTPSPDGPIADDVDVLTKPYRRDELAHKLRLVLGQG